MRKTWCKSWGPKEKTNVVSVQMLQLDSVGFYAPFKAKRSDDEDIESYKLVKVAWE